MMNKPAEYALFYYFSLLTMAIVAGGYFFAVYKYSINIPFWDDYTHLKVITELTSSDSLPKKIQLLFSLHNEHRIVFARLVTLATLMLSGKLNFIVLILLGNLSLLGIGVLLFLVFNGNKKEAPREKVIYFLPVVLLLFNLSYHEASVWAVAALSSLMVVFLSFSCLFILLRFEAKTFVGMGGAFVLGMLAAYTQGNGLFILYVGLFLLILKKRLAGALFWGLGAGIISGLYFYDYVSPGFHTAPSAVFSELGLALRYLLTFLGAWANLPTFGGACAVGLFIWLTCQGLYRRNAILFGFLSFICVSALAVTASRYGMGIEQALSSRYKVYSLLFFSLLYMAMFEFLEWRWLAYALQRGFPILLVLFFGISGYIATHAMDAMAAHQQTLVNGLINWRQGGEGLTHWDAEVAHQIMVDSMKKDIYHPPSFH
jgi:hypothetical protein